MTEKGHQRRIDRILDEGYLDGLAERPLGEVRALRDDCRDEEGRLSYARRLAQGRIDIVAAEQARRSGEQTGDLLESLPSILADAPHLRRGDPNLNTSSLSVHAYPEVGGRGEEHLLVDASLGRLPDLSDSEVAELLERLSAEERRLSTIRQTLHARLDTLQAELVRRYREGGVEFDEVIAAAIAEDGSGS